MNKYIIKYVLLLITLLVKIHSNMILQENLYIIGGFYISISVNNEEASYYEINQQLPASYFTAFVPSFLLLNM